MTQEEADKMIDEIEKVFETELGNSGMSIYLLMTSFAKIQNIINSYVN